MSRESNLIKNTFTLGLGTVLPRLAQFIVLPILTSCLTVEEYGVYDFVFVLVSLLLPAASLQMPSAAFRFLIDVKEDKEECTRIVTGIFVVILPVSLVVLTGLFFVYRSVPYITRLLICLYLLLDFLCVANRNVLRGLCRNREYSRNAILTSLCRLVCIIVVLKYFHMGLNGALLSLAITCFISMLLLTFGCRLYKYFDLKAVSKAKIKEMLAYSWPLVPTGLSAWVIKASDRLVVTTVLGAAMNGLYSAASKLPHLFTIVQNTLSMAWQENASVHVKDEDAHKYYSSMFMKMYGISAGMISLVIGLSPWLFPFFIRGKEYYAGWAQMFVLFLALFFKGMAEFLGGIYVAYKDSKSVGVTTAVAAVINLAIDLIFIRSIGLYAASVSTLAAYFCLFLFRAIDVRKYVKVDYHFPRLFGILALVIGECVLCYINGPLTNLINAGIGIVAFLVLDRQLIKLLWSKGMHLLKKRIARTPDGEGKE